MNKTIRIKLQLEIDRDGDGYHAYCPALKGFHVGGQTEAEAILAATDAARAYISSILKHGDPLPVGCNVSEVRPSFFERVKALGPSRQHLVTTEVSCAA